MNLVGFGHRSGHGKDTAANFLNTHLRIMVPRIRIKKISFADKLKDITFQLYQWAGVRRAIEYENNRDLRNEIIPHLNMTVVDLWVSVGEKLREVYPRTWLDYVTKTDHQADIVIVSDVRHPNEANTIRDNTDWRLYKVHNPNVPNRTGKSIDDMLEGYTRWDATITNDKTLKELNVQMAELANYLVGLWGLKK